MKSVRSFSAWALAAACCADVAGGLTVGGVEPAHLGLGGGVSLTLGVGESCLLPWWKA